VGFALVHAETPSLGIRGKGQPPGGGLAGGAGRPGLGACIAAPSGLKRNPIVQDGREPCETDYLCRPAGLALAPASPRRTASSANPSCRTAGSPV